MKVILFTCVKLAVTDATTNALSLFQVMEELQTPSFPLAIPSFTIVIILERERGDRKKTLLHYRLKLGRQTLVELPLEINFLGRKRYRNHGVVHGLTIPQPGTLKAEIRLKNRTLGSWSIEVSHTGQTASLTPTIPVKQAANAPTTPKTRKAGKKSARKPKAAVRTTPKTRKTGKKGSRKP